MSIIGKGLGSKLSTIVALGLWIVSMLLIYDKNYATPETRELVDIPIDGNVSGEFQNWMNVTMNGAKIGYTMQSFTNSPLGYVLKDYSLIRLPMGGTIREIYLDSYAVLSLDLSLKNFTFGLVSGEYTSDVFGEVRNGRLNVKLRSQNNESEVSIDAEKGVFLPGVIPLLAKARGFPEGEFTLPTFDPFSLAMSEIQVVIGAEEEVAVQRGKAKGRYLQLNVSGIASKMWVDAGGHVLREEETGGMMMLATSKEAALDVPEVEVGDLDILDELAVPCVGEVSDPRNASSILVRIDGIEAGLFDLEDDFQTVVSTNPLIIEIHPDTITHSTIGDAERFFASEPFIQVRDPRIVNMAHRIVESETLARAKSDRIGRWVYENVEKDYAVSLPSAVDVLDVRKGDCNEHTALFTALARASGLPTKICIGLVYKDGRFYYHAWSAVHLDGWTPVDPTFGQDIADATHIKLLEGGFERQADLMRVVGKVTVTILQSPEEQSL